MKSKKVGIVGNGAIGKHLRGRLEQMDHEVCFAFGRNNQNVPFAELLASTKVDAVFIAISTLDEGQAALEYMLACINAGIPVITCEKGALAYHAEKLKLHLSKIGFSAAVGGGTMMLKYLQYRRLVVGSMNISAVINGTLNYILGEVRHGGRSLAEACTEAVKLGYAEPGAKDPLSVINGELGDVMRKVCVLFNTLLSRTNVLTPHKFGSLAFDAKSLTQFNEVAGDYRLVVNFSNTERSEGRDFFGKEFGLYSQDGWGITGSFRQITNRSGLESWLPAGVGNALYVVEGELGAGGQYTLSGPGAGHEPTTTAMLADFADFFPQ